MNLVLLVEVLLVAHHLHLHVPEAVVPHVEVVVDLLLELPAEAEPHCEGAPQHLPVDHNIEEVHEVVVRGVLGQQLHAQPLLVDQLVVEVYDLLLGLVDDELEDVGIGDEDAAFVGADLEEGHSEAVLLFGVQAVLFGEGKALGGAQTNPGCAGQLQELEQGRTVKLVGLDEFDEVGLKVLLPLHAVLHHVLVLVREGRQGHFCVVREDLEQLIS